LGCSRPTAFEQGVRTSTKLLDFRTVPQQALRTEGASENTSF
jgi:hypothetical protein